ncbi:MAG: DNA repair protein RecO [Ruminococcaceae bacterium]|nr:DNA repair protein RecO [Oscillospiraceae bacterium]
MEEIEVDGLIIREVKTGEADKMLTVLTSKLGRITISGKGVGSIRSKFASSVQLFSYSTFMLRKKGNFYYIKDAYYIESFMNIRYDIEKLSLAAYVCDVANDLSPEDMADEDLLPLVLNTLYAIANFDSIPLTQIKGAFEFRAMTLAGFMPDLEGCGVCGCDITEDSALDVMNGRLLCKKCRGLIENDPDYIRDEGSAKIMIRVSPAVLMALRYIESAHPKKFLSFTLDEQELSLFSVVCERYLLNHLEHSFSSLDYYKKIKL